jgi:hypothetical protein
MLIRSLLALTLPLALSFATSCSATMSIRSMEPAAVHVGSTNHLVILDGEGRRSAREYVNMEVMRQCRSRGYFSVEDRSEEGFEVRVGGRNATVEGGQFTLDGNQAGLRVDVLEWNAYRDEHEVSTKGKNGEVVTQRTPVTRGQVLLAITFFGVTGSTFLAETEYEGWASIPVDRPREEAIECAAQQAIAAFLNDVTPVQVVARVRLDDEDPGQEAILETARAGNVAMAARDMRAYLEQNPLNASAAYNLAVFLEATGEFPEAMAMYDSALSLGTKDFYVSARAGCARRLAASEELNQGAPTP